MPIAAVRALGHLHLQSKAWLQRRRTQPEPFAIRVMEGLAEPPGVCDGAAAVSHRHADLLQLAHDAILQQIRAIRSICRRLAPHALHKNTLQLLTSS